MVQLSLVIPLYNEEKVCLHGIKEIVSTLKRRGIDYELILVDNGSYDNTEKVIDYVAKRNKRVVKIHLKKNQGFGGGILSGLKHARGDFIGWTSCDGEIDGIDIANTFTNLLVANGDIAKTRRIQRNDGPLRFFLAMGYTFALLLLFFKYFPDINSGPKIIRRKSFQKVRLKHKDWFIDTELMLKARKLGLIVIQTDVVYKKRAAGESHVSFATVLEFFKNLISRRISGF